MKVWRELEFLWRQFSCENVGTPKKQPSTILELSPGPVAAPAEKVTFPYSSKAPGSAGTIGTGFPPLGSGFDVTKLFLYFLLYNIVALDQLFPEKVTFPYSSKAPRNTGTIETGFPPLGSGFGVTKFF